MFMSATKCAAVSSEIPLGSATEMQKKTKFVPQQQNMENYDKRGFKTRDTAPLCVNHDK